MISCFPISWLVNSLMSLLSIQNAYIKKSHIITMFVDSWIWKVGTYFWMTLFCKWHLLTNGVFTYVIFIDNSIFYIYQISVLQMSRIYVILLLTVVFLTPIFTIHDVFCGQGSDSSVHCVNPYKTSHTLTVFFVLFTKRNIAFEIMFTISPLCVIVQSPLNGKTFSPFTFFSQVSLLT